jgi:restriction endonuclease S subunit
MTTLQQYKKYYPVSYEYANQLPDGWQLLPNIAIFQERIERGYENEELLSVTIGRGVIKQADLDKKDSSTLDKSKYLLVYPADLVYSMRFRQGASGYSNYKGIVSPACTVLKPRKGVKYHPRYFHFMFRTGFYKNYAERYAYGIADGQMPLRYVDFKRMYSIVPPLEVQNNIVAYLDKKNNEIDKFIRNKKRLIELVEQHKREVIRKKIDSGAIEIKLKYILRIQNGDGISTELVKDDGEYEVFGGNGVLGYFNKFNVSNETLIIGRVGALCGNVHYVNKNVWVNDNAMFVKTKQHNRYMYYLLLNANLNSLSFANAQPLITGTLVKNCLTKFHKDYETQNSIVLEIEEKLNELNLVIEKAQKEISSIKEYREALITDLVTGKRSVPQ